MIDVHANTMFVVTQEVTVGEAPILMTLVYTSSHESLVCVGYKHQFDLISEAGDVSRIHSVDKQKVMKWLVEICQKTFY